MVTDFQATYHDIVENERIILVYDMFRNDEKLSVSLLTLEFTAEGDRTRLLHTEQGLKKITSAEVSVRPVPLAPPPSSTHPF